MTWQDKAKSAMRVKGITQEKLAGELEVSQGGLGHWLNGRREPSLDMLEKIAKRLGYGLSDFLENNKKEEYEPETATEEHFAFIPFYDAHASCGDGYANGDHAVIKSELAFKRSWLKDEGLQEKDLAIITAKGDSMSPTINDGSILLINTNYKRVESGRVYAIAVDDQVRVKRLFLGLGGDCRIVSDNPNKMLYPDETISPEILDKLHIVGRVVWMGGML